MSEEMKQREAFQRAAGNMYDYTMDEDSWCRPQYLKSHIESMFHGWQLARTQPDNTQLIADFKACVDALKSARMRIDYLGIQADERHYLSNIKDFLPPIDEALTLAEKYKQLFEDVKAKPLETVSDSPSTELWDHQDGSNRLRGKP